MLRLALSQCMFASTVVSVLVSLWLRFLCREMEEMSGLDPNCDDMQRKDQRLPFQVCMFHRHTEKSEVQTLRRCVWVCVREKE